MRLNLLLLKRVSVPAAMVGLAFAGTLALSGMAAFALTAGTEESARLDDVQIGERGNQTRIALLCSTPCNAEKRTNTEFVLRGIQADMALDLSDRSKYVSNFTATSDAAGSLLDVTVRQPVDYANAKNCTVSGRAAVCIDLFFSVDKTAALSESVQKSNTPAPRNVAEIEKPSIREAAPERFAVFARLAPPERLKPPTGAILAKVQPIEETVDVQKPSVRAPATTVKTGFDYSVRVRALLGKELTPAFCNNAQTTLHADPWALKAMVDFGLCTAARGDATEAEDILSRLLEYTPDNYEAHVGRALIAAQAGEKGIARKYFQEALNALPPIEESNRIVNAMEAL